MKTATLAFDIYGTLIDTGGISARLADYFGGDKNRADAFAARWRQTQLEYSFRRGLMGVYADFGVCTKDALAYACEALSAPLDDKQRADLLDRYARLPMFADAKEGLEKLTADKRLRLFAFSNGAQAAVKAVLAANDALHFFADIISADEVRSFKPAPAVYANFLRRAESKPADTWLISSNPFDVIGARAALWNAVWLCRKNAAPFDPWEFTPTKTIDALSELPLVFARAEFN
jgi:2-haloacid dehalogenase